MSVLRRIKYKALLLSMGAAFLCLLLAYWFISSFKPSLGLRLVSDSGRITLRFTNTGKKQLSLDTIGMEYFIFRPSDDSGKYLVVVQDKEQGSRHEKALREAAMTVLRPGEHVDVGNVSPFLQGLPRGDGDAVAVYSTHSGSGRADAWQGTVKSVPFLFSIN